MEQLTGRVAVVTGAANGIGLAIVRCLAGEGMSIVMADIDPVALTAAAEELTAAGADVLPVPTNVADAASVEALASQAAERYGNVHLLCNNAGVVGRGACTNLDLDEWRWVLGVNLMGVIHGVRSFLPAIIAHGAPAHIMNTASLAGLLGSVANGAYTASKAAVVGLSESLHMELAMTAPQVGVSVLCPAWVNTRIADDSHTRLTGQDTRPAEPEARKAALAQLFALGEPASKVASIAVQAIKTGRFYVFTDQSFDWAVKQRTDSILAGSPPALRPTDVLPKP